MSYVVTWLSQNRVIAERKFDDLFKAQSYVYKMSGAYKKRGATAARVWNGRATYFQIEWPPLGLGQKRSIH